MNKKWTKEEITFLIENYENSNDDFLKNNLDRTWSSIKQQAIKQKIKRYYRNDRLADMKLMLNDDVQTYYWIGFILADGHIGNNRLKITLATNDSEHVEKFKKFIEHTGDVDYTDTNATISIMDKKYISKLCDKFDIKSNKTIFPCNISRINDDNLLFSLIIGFIDGDGSIRNLHKRKDFCIRVKCHMNWKENLEYMINFLYNLFGKSEYYEIDPKNEYAYFCISDTEIQKKIKQKVLDLKLPVLDRKWDIIDLNYMGKYEKSRNDREKFSELIKQNKNISVKELCKELNLKEGTIYKYYRQLV